MSDGELDPAAGLGLEWSAGVEGICPYRYVISGRLTNRIQVSNLKYMAQYASYRNHHRLCGVMVARIVVADTIAVRFRAQPIIRYFYFFLCYFGRFALTFFP